LALGDKWLEESKEQESKGGTVNPQLCLYRVKISWSHVAGTSETWKTQGKYSSPSLGKLFHFFPQLIFYQKK
jgi:hypothetical protein